MRTLAALALLGCSSAQPTPAIRNATRNSGPVLRADRFERASLALREARRFLTVGLNLNAYANAQRGLNLLAGDPENQDTQLEVSATVEAERELQAMAELRIRELETKLAARP